MWLDVAYYGLMCLYALIWTAFSGKKTLSVQINPRLSKLAGVIFFQGKSPHLVLSIAGDDLVAALLQIIQDWEAAETNRPASLSGLERNIVVIDYGC